MIHAQASRNVALARLLLAYPQWRWAEGVNDTIKMLLDISRLGDFALYEHMEQFLPGASPAFYKSLCVDPKAEDGAHDLRSTPPSECLLQRTVVEQFPVASDAGNHAMLGVDFDSIMLQNPDDWCFPDTMWETLGSLP
jgi:hypothetical protein